MSRIVPVYQQLASLIEAIRNCQQSSNAEWENNHKRNVQQIVRDFLPRGAGWDVGTEIELASCTPDRIVLYGSYHHMDDVGYYDGWTDHSIIVTPSLSREFNLRITGRNRNEVKDYLHEIFDLALRQRITQLADERGPKGFVWVRAESLHTSPEVLVSRIADALGTGEEGDGLVEVARNAHTAEQELAALKRKGVVTPAPDEHVAAARAVQERTEATVLHGYIDNLRRAIQMHSKHLSDDDSLLSAQDVVHTARMVLERIHDDVPDPDLSDAKGV